MIKYNAESRIFIIETNNSSYIFKLNDKGVPIHIYYGSKLLNPDEIIIKGSIDKERLTLGVTGISKYTPEYAAYCKGMFDEESFKAIYFDNQSNVELSYKCHRIEDDLLALTLTDEAYSLEITLEYLVREDLDIIERRAIIKNNGNTMEIENAASATIHLPAQKDYEIYTFSGSWCREYTPVRCKIPEGKISFDTRRGVSSGPHHVPFFAVSNANFPANEQSGELYFGILKYAGNFRNVFEKNNAGVVKITTGINFFDTKVKLNRGESFETPTVIIGFTHNGYSGMREHIYDLEFNVLANKNNISKPFPIIYNSWYPYLFNVNEEKLIALIPKVKEIGAELLVIDDGWMIGRVNDKGGLGDWYEDKEAFPNGIKAISKKVHENGLLFGIWVEPEMLTEDSALYKEHPDWVLGYENRETTYIRNQRVLNLSRDDVYFFCEQTLDRIIEDYELDYLKWDMNRYICETDTTSDFYIKYTKNLTRLYKHIREKFPRLLIENCAHGGARSDFGLFEYCDRINRSDNADPIDVMKLHSGFADMFLPRYAGGAGNIAPSPYHLSHREAPLEYRAALGMTGSMSVGIDLLTASSDEIQKLKEYISYYKSIRPILHNSYFYKLSQPIDENTVVWEYLARDRRNAVVFIFSNGLNFASGLRSVKPIGLIPEKKYEVMGQVLSGDTLMKFGIDFFEGDCIKQDYYSKLIEIKEVQ